MRMCLLGGGSACNRLLSDVFQQNAGPNVGVTCPVMFGVAGVYIVVIHCVLLYVPVRVLEWTCQEFVYVPGNI